MEKQLRPRYELGRERLEGLGDREKGGNADLTGACLDFTGNKAFRREQGASGTGNKA